MAIRSILTGLIAVAALGACGPVKWVKAETPSADQQAIDRRHDNELARLCQIMSRDDPRYKSADCDDRRPGGR
ncbi:hypothetical protein QOZ96_000864 [Brevundimonas nasdae]|jgi:hypothetical protein|uniref:Lipoprotein n=1 Tax=Brevundimonas nasdae TaxID=172043 RepID=A0ABX8TJV5_9CAUL|nr:hypothetical protein [Brevundimonas nasdae]MBK6024276.1 hypothetical protein [Brevundimonas nasdae]MDQ0450933.1 hypothetical protein [Brevundimonas nasdae]QYC11284.1 hypothetical protein KWG56_04635 [Brevundimonas nasdae]QYC14072.1 hypothetical protein KWG63_18185 [Brevundimonas nasdae]